MYIVIAVLVLAVLAGGCALAVYGLLALMGKRPTFGRNHRPDAENAQTTGDAPMLESIHTPERPFYDRLLFRAVIVGIITLVMLIPLDFVQDMVRERSYLYREVIDNISSLWGLPQSINGPCLAVPYSTITRYTETFKDDDGKVVTVPKQRIDHFTMIILPENLDYKAELNPQELHRGIYNYVVYNSPVTLTGNFKLPPASAFASNLHEIYWSRAWFALGVTDLKAITEAGNLSWDNKEAAPFSPGSDLKNMLGPGFHTVLDLPGDSAGTNHSFALTMKLNGSGGLYFTPVGERTTITVTGAWAHPSFSGSILPKERNITDAGFMGHWDIPHLARTYPQTGDLGVEFSEEGGQITPFKAGVDLFEAVSLYTQVNRATKYGLLFIGMTFMALLAFELLTERRIHLFQYALVGVSMSLFYLVLLSLAEHTSFGMAFTAASAVSVVMNGLYITASMKSAAKGCIITVLLAALYVLLFALLQMEDYALLMGTALVIIVVGVLMFLTRNLSSTKPANPAPAGQ